MSGQDMMWQDRTDKENNNAYRENGRLQGTIIECVSPWRGIMLDPKPTTDKTNCSNTPRRERLSLCLRKLCAGNPGYRIKRHPFRGISAFKYVRDGPCVAIFGHHLKIAADVWALPAFSPPDRMAEEGEGIPWLTSQKAFQQTMESDKK
ncbi:hypothetical protein JB92DRAFT_1451064 [Gautieria morchelliformis]|nr:hypothetical protein JB92DRAFT_1451064 [Gautieria morchelliformis]